ncbi:MAG TPA: HAD family hydrolase [Tepidiformaceae bacterium]|nr:HAD family hydrolase [Tepidiformaceae bacterium]
MGEGTEAILFDLDDTIGDWATAVDRTVLSAGLSEVDLARIGAALREFVCVRREARIVDRHHWRLFHEDMEWESIVEDASVAKILRAAFRTAERPGPYTDADVLAELGLDYRIGLLTNNPYGEAALAKYGLRGHFEAVVMMDEPFLKPHRRGFEEACAALDLPPGRVAMVGDSLANDVEGALSAGLVPIWVDRFHDGYVADAGVHRIESLRELPELLRSI